MMSRSDQWMCSQHVMSTTPPPTNMQRADEIVSKICDYSILKQFKKLTKTQSTPSGMQDVYHSAPYIRPGSVRWGRGMKEGGGVPYPGWGRKGRFTLSDREGTLSWLLGEYPYPGQGEGYP